MDSTPFRSITDILQSFQDSRLWIFANWVWHPFLRADCDCDSGLQTIFVLTANGK